MYFARGFQGRGRGLSSYHALTLSNNCSVQTWFSMNTIASLCAHIIV